MKKLKWWQWGLIGLLGVSLVQAIAGMSSPPKPAAEKFATDDPEFKLIAGRSVFAMTFDANSDPNAILAAARKKCNEFTHCQVHAWTQPDRAAGAFPMTDREVEALAFSYTLNRTTGMDEASWKCANWSGIGRQRCLKKFAR
ncbi:MAG: hypothetical protein IBJ13_01465 [Sphingopyxis sp.]|nr:hypothetical protein [Sphingopyxis sp.]